MKTIGLLGGMSWESTLTYYKVINQSVGKTLGGLHSAKVVLHSVDFEEIAQLQKKGDWQGASQVLQDAARSAEAGGADMLLICTNTMHIVADEIQQAVSIPLLHIADAAGETLQAQGHHKVGLLGTAFTMEQDFYAGRIQEKFGIEVIVPDADGRKAVHDIIYNELCMGKIHDASREVYLNIMDELAARGAQAVILGCTEIGLLVQQAHTDIPLLDTTLVHAQKACEAALADV